MNRRSFRSQLGSDKSFRDLPDDPDPDELLDLVSRLRSGDHTVRARLVELHVKLVTTIAGRMAPANNVDDAIQEANRVLLEAVDRAVTALHDNEITAYISATVRHEVRKFLNEDRCVKMPSRTFRHKAAKGEINKDGDNLDPALVGVVSTMKLVMSEERESRTSGDENVISIGRYMPGYTIPEARPEWPSMEMREALNLAILTPQEHAYVEMASEGYTFKEIGDRYGVTSARVGQVVRRVEDRFNRYMTA